MSDNIIPFNKNEEEHEHQCESCDLVHEFMSYVIDATSPDELFEVLSGLVHEAKTIGMRELLVSQIDSKIELLDHLDGCCEEEF